MRWKIGMALASVVAVTLVATGCSGSSPEANSTGEGGSPGSAQCTGGLTIWNPQDQWRATSKYLMNDFTAFKESHPNVDVNVVDIPYGQYEARYAAGFASGNEAPDIFMGQVAYYAGGLGVAAPAPENLQKKWTENLVSSTAPAFQLDGKWYGYPVSTDLGMQLYYNVAQFKEVGLDPAAPPQTFEQLREYADKLTVRNGDQVTRNGMAIRYSGTLVGIADKALPYIHAFGGTLYSLDEKTADGYLNGEGTVKGLTFMQDLVQKDRDASLELGSPDDTFVQGLSSMTFREGWFEGYLDESAPDLEYAVAPYPEGPAGYPKVSLLFNWGWMVNADSPCADVAWEWLDAVSNPETDLELAKLEGYLPVWTSNYEDPFVTARKDYVAVQKQLEEGPGPFYSAPLSNEIHTRIGEAVEAILQGAPVQQTLDDAVAEIDPLLAQGNA